MYARQVLQRYVSKENWPKHKRDCKIHAAELRDKALFKDPPPKEDCPICFLPMPAKLISCISLPPATLSSVPINDFAIANVELYKREMGQYYPCCGKAERVFVQGAYIPFMALEIM